MSIAEFDADVVVDARNCILGRVASEVAQRALDGDRVAIVNAEDAVITGDKEDVFDTYRTRLQLGSDRGPNYPRRPDTIFKRSVRGMLPHKKPRGREAFDNVRVYVGNPYADDDEHEAEILEDTSLDRLSNIRFVHLGEVSEQLGANVTW
ncbi:50S ribosomal protein L13 [Halosolutus halophilus]|uniref:50S ribosomal protein L13 n=1 Tax=Halosolutus halophilus TaxID=1552990 RepID=UPI002234ED85|nr:50S ribosomal protein L13 [Halosolutus halophilus]